MEIEIKKISDTLNVQQHLLSLAPELEKKKIFICTIKRKTNKRSKNANDYSWTLQTTIAKATNRKVDDIHTEMVLQYGVIETYSILKEAFDSAVRIFDYYKIQGESQVNGKTFIHIKAAVGTRFYDTKEMYHFVEGVIAEAKDLGIETRTPKEIAEMMSLWEKGER